MKYNILDWDSNFFGIKVAEISPSIQDQDQLSQTIEELKSIGVKLAYWASLNKLPKNVAEILEGSLVDQKVTYGIDLTSKYIGNYHPPAVIIPYNPSFGIGDLEQLSIQSGHYSRFATDSKIEKEKFETLYKIWIRRSLAKEISDQVFVVPNENKAVGMITVGNKTGIGNIGLLAVNASFRGNKYGELLVRTAQHWLSNSGYTKGEVVTQRNNIAACKLYEKCGFTISSSSYFYHFWL